MSGVAPLGAYAQLNRISLLTVSASPNWQESATYFEAVFEINSANADSSAKVWRPSTQCHFPNGVTPPTVSCQD